MDTYIEGIPHYAEHVFVYDMLKPISKAELPTPLPLIATFSSDCLIRIYMRDADYLAGGVANMMC